MKDTNEGKNSFNALKQKIYFFSILSLVLIFLNIYYIDKIIKISNIKFVKIDRDYIENIMQFFTDDLLESFKNLTFEKRMNYFLFYRNPEVLIFSKDLLTSLKILNREVNKFIKYESDMTLWKKLQYIESIPEIMIYKKGDNEEYSKLFAFITICGYKLKTSILGVLHKKDAYLHYLVKVKLYNKYYYFDPFNNKVYEKFPSYKYKRKYNYDLTSEIFWEIDPYEWQTDRGYEIYEIIFRGY